MQKDPRTPVEIVDDEAPGIAEVDAKLVELAKRRSRVVLTNDFNLNRVAQLQGVRVMNLNSLANAVKPAFLPGEELRVKVIQEGKEAGPGRRLPRRRHDDRGRGRRPADRPRGGRQRHPRPADRRRPDDLRPAAPGLTAVRSGASRADGATPWWSRPARRARMGGTDKLLAVVGGRPLARLDGRGRRGRAGRRAARPRHAPERVAEPGGRDWLPGGVAVVAGGARARRPSPRPASAPGALDGGPHRPRPAVLVHDGARPLVSAGARRRGRRGGRAHGAAIPVVPVAETLKRVDDGA